MVFWGCDSNSYLWDLGVGLGKSVMWGINRFDVFVFFFLSRG